MDFAEIHIGFSTEKKVKQITQQKSKRHVSLN